MITNKDNIDDLKDQEMIAAFENGEMQSIPNLQAEMARMRRSAKKYLKKDSRISIRLSSSDLYMIRRQAASKGLPYQSFISSILHQFVTGQMKPA